MSTRNPALRSAVSISALPVVMLSFLTTSIAQGAAVWQTRAPFEGLLAERKVIIDGLGRIVSIAGYDLDNGDSGADRVWDPIEGFTGSFPQLPGKPSSWGVAVARDATGRVYAIGGSAEPGLAADSAATAAIHACSSSADSLALAHRPTALPMLLRSIQRLASGRTASITIWVLGGHCGIWIGSAESWLDLHAPRPT